MQVIHIAASRPSFEHDLLGKTEAEIILEENPVGFDVDREAVQMIEPAHIDAARGISLGLILQRRLQFRTAPVPLGFVIELDLVAVRILADECGTVPEIAIGPADVDSRSL